MKKVLGIIGIGFIASAAFSFLFNKKEKRKNNINTSIKEFSSVNTVPTINKNDIHVENAGLEDVKASAVRNMYTRHEEASKIMKESVDIICSRTEISEDKNSDLEQISDELDELLREG